MIVVLDMACVTALERRAEARVLVIWPPDPQTEEEGESLLNRPEDIAQLLQTPIIRVLEME